MSKADQIRLGQIRIARENARGSTGTFAAAYKRAIGPDLDFLLATVEEQRQKIERLEGKETHENV